jgi:hypothetical protein
MSSGHDVSEYELDTSGLSRVCFTTTTVEKLIKIEKNHDFFKKKKLLVWCDDPPEDRVISIFVGCLVNQDRVHRHNGRSDSRADAPKHRSCRLTRRRQQVGH